LKAGDLVKGLVKDELSDRGIARKAGRLSGVAESLCW